MSPPSVSGVLLLRRHFDVVFFFPYKHMSLCPVFKVRCLFLFYRPFPPRISEKPCFFVRLSFRETGVVPGSPPLFLKLLSSPHPLSPFAVLCASLSCPSPPFQFFHGLWSKGLYRHTRVYPPFSVTFFSSACDYTMFFLSV